MGLAITVGFLADMLANDPEGAAWFEENLAAVNRVLKAERLPRHDEPRSLPPLDSRAAPGSFPYSTLHYLRRAYAHRVRDPQWVATPLPAGAEPTADPVLEEAMDRFDSHLLCHSDAEGFYLPIDFPDVLVDGDDGDEIPGGLVGSTHRLRAELALVAPALGIALVDGALADAEAGRLNDVVRDDGPLWHELAAWLSLWEAARLSLAHRTAIVFC